MKVKCLNAAGALSNQHRECLHCRQPVELQHNMLQPQKLLNQKSYSVIDAYHLLDLCYLYAGLGVNIIIWYAD